MLLSREATDGRPVVSEVTASSSAGIFEFSISMRLHSPFISNLEGASSSSFFQDSVPRGRRASSSGFPHTSRLSLPFAVCLTSSTRVGARFRFLTVCLYRAEAASRKIKTANVTPKPIPSFTPLESCLTGAATGSVEGVGVAVPAVDDDDFLPVVSDVAPLALKEDDGALENVDELSEKDAVVLLLLDDEGIVVNVDGAKVLLLKDGRGLKEVINSLLLMSLVVLVSPMSLVSLALLEPPGLPVSPGLLMFTEADAELDVDDPVLATAVVVGLGRSPPS